jgi:GntR family trehalose operon transcriptional repressor
MTKYEAIFKEIASKIETDALSEGDLLPSEHELMKQYNASRDTIRKALNLLIQNGYIQKSQGRRSIVLDIHRFKRPISNIESFKEVSKHYDEETSTEVIFLDKIHPDERVAKNLQVAPSDYVWMLMRLRKFSGEPAILDTDFLRTDIVPELPIEAAADSLYEYLEKTLHLEISYADKIITCQNANGMDKKYLDLKDYNMVVNVESFAYLSNAQIFQYTSSRHRPDKFRFEDRARRIKKV